MPRRSLQHKYDLAETSCLKSIEMFTKLFEEHHLKGSTYMILSTIYHKQNRLSEWEEVGLKLISCARKKFEVDSAKLMLSLSALGLNYIYQEREIYG